MEPLPDRADELVDPLRDRGLCDACLGRSVAKLGYGLTNTERGRSLRDAEVPPEDCSLCEGLSGTAERIADLALRAAEDLEHATFALGCRVDDDLETREEALYADHGLEETFEPLRTQLTREAGKRYEARSEASFEPQAPDLMLIVDTRFWAVETEISPRYVQGRYLKTVRGIPQTRWECRDCRGTGCRECDMTGKLYEDSVEELVGRPAVEAFDAREAVLHGQGREDVDARMLGTGRPFVLELKRPFTRSVDLDELAASVQEGSDGRVEVRDLRYVPKDAVSEVKQTRSEKTYRVDVAFEAPVDVENLKKATAVLRGATVQQRTPSRVAHRRSDRVRTRTVRRCEIESRSPRRARLLVRGDAGLYIKELVSGDGGRTEPNLSAVLGVEAEVSALDVVAVEA